MPISTTLAAGRGSVRAPAGMHIHEKAAEMMTNITAVRFNTVAPASTCQWSLSCQILPHNGRDGRRIDLYFRECGSSVAKGAVTCSNVSESKAYDVNSGINRL
jgi:hypothetical protein